MPIRSLPRLDAVRLSEFSLYARRPDVSVEFHDDVFCLAGANGLGKSTFLALVTYGLTGRVPEPDRSFQTMNTYMKESRDFTREYFVGRVRPSSLNSASVTLTFTLGEATYEISRGFESPENILLLSRTVDHQTETWVPENGLDSIGQTYESLFCSDSGLEQFSQFVFLQHFVLTFDERRNLIFWEPLLTENALLLAFSGDVGSAARATELRAEMDRFGSRARNSRWQASSTRTRMNALKSADISVRVDGEAVADARFARVQDAWELNRIRQLKVEDIQRAVIDSHVAFGESSSELRSLSREMEGLLEERASKRRSPSRHALTIEARATDTCYLCGSQGKIREVLDHAEATGRCPLCDESLEEGESSLDLDPRLVNLDERMQKLRARLDDSRVNLERLERELSSAQASLTDSAILLEEFDLEDRIAVQRRNDGVTQSLDAALEAMNVEYNMLTREADKYIETRDTIRAELDPLLKALGNSYRDAESVFVPDFRGLAENFIGLPLDIELVSGGLGPTGLRLSVDGTSRTKTTQLSESQRFFLDIALRMALVKHLTRHAPQVTVYVDTPEGSLDIAYEARAGELFAAFASNGKHLVMTSNINASNLLLRLAAICGPGRLHLERMTEWATLSQVQIAESQLFDDAFAGIEAARESGGQ